MASKIFTRAKPFPKACIKPPDITEIRMLPGDKGDVPFFQLIDNKWGFCQNVSNV